MPRSEQRDEDCGRIVGSVPEPPPSLAGISPEYPAPPELIESWDPVDDQMESAVRHRVQWNWHGRPSWGRKAVAVFPLVAVVLALGLIVHTTVEAQGAIDQVQSVVGTGGATLLLSAPPQSNNGSSAGTGQTSDYHDVTFSQPSDTNQPIQGSTSLAVPPYVGWEANGSAGADNAVAAVNGGLLHVGVRRPTPDFRGWFLTTTGATPDSCAFQFSAASPPPVTVSTPGAVGELVMAVQTSNTISTGDINYVVVAESVYPSGQRSLAVGYSLGHVSQASEHVLKRAPWVPGPLQVAIETNGENRLGVWVNGALFFSATDLHMGIVPPLEPYLEVQARQTAYTASFSGYSSVCQSNVVVSNLPNGTVATLGHQSVAAHNGSAVFPGGMASPPVTGVLTLALPGVTRPIRFDPHTYWPGDRLSFEPGT